MSRCFSTDIADRLIHGQLRSDEFTQALKHAGGCEDCRQRLFSASRPAPNVDGSMDAIQERLTTWRAARRAPLMPAFPWSKGHQVDRYVIIRSVGGTEDGVIYEAFDPERDDRVVVKQLDLHIEDPATPALMTLAHQLTQLSHPNLLHLLSVGTHTGFVYFVYEFVKGTPLSAAGFDDPRHIIGLYAEAGRGLDAAHEGGIAHGCFSASSCMVGRDGRVRVLDFGVGEARIHRVTATKTVRDQEWTTSNAQVSSEDSFVGFIPARQRGSTGQFESIVLAAGPNSLGPRLYAAPELVLGAAPSPASDQFSFCAALFHRLYGRPPFDGETIALWLRELLKGGVAAPPAVAGVPAGVQQALLRGLSRDPAARFDRMATLVARLSRGGAAPAHRKRRIAAIAIAATALVTGVVVASGLRGGAGAASLGSCDHGLAGWSTLWSQPQQDELTRAAGPAGADAVPALRTRLDAWVGSWKRATHNFCSLPAAAAECPARAHAAAADLLQLVKDGPARVQLAAAAAEALPTPDQCTSSAPSPALAPIAVVKADVRRRLGMLDDADQLTAKLAEDPAQRSYQSLIRGYTAADRGDLLSARRLFEDATFEAQSAKLPELGATAALQRLALSCSAPERALWSGYVDAQVKVSGKPVPASELRAALADSLLCEGKVADAVKLRRDVAQALASDETAVGAAAALELARAQLAQGDLASAEGVARSAAGIYTKLYGARHPLAQIARLTAAEAELGVASTRGTAAATVSQVIAELADHKEPHAVRGRALALQSRIAEARGAHDDAVALAHKATGELEASLGGTHPELASALLATGDLLLGNDKDKEAEAAYRQVAAIYETLGQSDSMRLAHARAGIQLARWGGRVPADAQQTLEWGLSAGGDALDPAVAAWVAEQLGHRAAARGDAAAAIASYRTAAAAWQQNGDRRGVASALGAAALVAADRKQPNARAMLEEAMQASASASAAAEPRVLLALARLMWPAQRERARALVQAGLADVSAGSPEADELQQWLGEHR